MAYFDIDIACREGFGERKLVSMIQQRINSLPWDLDLNEQDFLTGYAYQDLRYYLLYKFGLLNLSNNDASYELCKRILRNEEQVTKIVDEWFNWWVIKWRQRVKLVFSENEQLNNENNNNANPQSNADELLKSIPKNLVDKLRREIIVELIRQNEVCSLDVVSDFILRTTLSELINEYGKDGTLKLISTNITSIRLRLLKKIMEIRDSNQPLVILRVRISPSQTYQGIS
ncbi:hypothetical protein [Vulcanisaeta distributa]|uniref:Uncharacterized protein n=1 Tax=Vulcanisaeta distributa (strain DSM 14429 / JCM 11212 / NBRC 100878 / IC-017) TaxID=572478 RepID=E1QRD3_VULDI|nr:hypothetical protein [Vulcanisaeta distributa]ADN50630.1 hypothetical protein Vdis_1244 [Vulcanisaeta distributa DSM 14429]